MRIRPLILLWLISQSACSGTGGQNTPEIDTVHYPTSVVTIADGTVALVSNTGLDRQYARGHLAVVDIVGGRVTDSGVLTGLFGGGMALSSEPNSNGERYLVIPTRDESLLELYAVTAGDETSVRLVAEYGDFGVRPMSGAPLNVVALGGGFMVSHPSQSVVSYWYLDEASEELRYGCSTTLSSGVHMLAKHPAAERVYVSSRLGSSIAVVGVESAGGYGDPTTRICRVKVKDYVNVGSRNSHGLAFDSDCI